MGVAFNSTEVGLSQVIVAVTLFCGVLESRNTTEVFPLPVSRPLICAEPPFAEMVDCDGMPLDGLTL